MALYFIMLAILAVCRPKRIILTDGTSFFVKSFNNVLLLVFTFSFGQGRSNSSYRYLLTCCQLLGLRLAFFVITSTHLSICSYLKFKKSNLPINFPLSNLKPVIVKVGYGRIILLAQLTDSSDFNFLISS